MKITPINILTVVVVLMAIYAIYAFEKTHRELREADQRLAFVNQLHKTVTVLDLMDRIKSAELAENYEQAAELKKELDKLKEA